MFAACHSFLGGRPRADPGCTVPVSRSSATTSVRHSFMYKNKDFGVNKQSIVECSCEKCFRIPNNVVFEDKVLSATNGLTFPLHFGLKQIYVRDCYEHLYDLAKTEWSLDQAVFVSGKPGVGKSFFRMTEWGRGLRHEAYVHKRILSHGLDATALKLGASDLLSANVPENNLCVQIPSAATRVILENNGVTRQLVAAIQTARTTANGGYLLPRLPNYPVIDSAFVPPAGAPQAQPLSLQMKAGNSKPLSPDKAASVVLNLGTTFVVVTPCDYVVKKQLPGPVALQQYLLVLNEDVSIGTEDPMEE